MSEHEGNGCTAALLCLVVVGVLIGALVIWGAYGFLTMASTLAVINGLVFVLLSFVGLLKRHEANSPEQKEEDDEQI